MGSLIHYIIENNVPSNWNLNYVSYFCPYVQLKLDNDTTEYKKIFNLVQSQIVSAYKNTYGIESIFRIQHPWSFASYQLRFSQTVRRTCYLPWEYVCISFLQENDNLELFLTNNCDRRILKKPNKNVKLAYAVVEKCFDYDNRTSSYPDYVLKLTNCKSNSGIAKLPNSLTLNQKQLSLPKMKKSNISYNDDLSKDCSYVSYGLRFPRDERFRILERYLCMILVGGCLSCSIIILMMHFIL